MLTHCHAAMLTYTTCMLAGFGVQLHPDARHSARLRWSGRPDESGKRPFWHAATPSLVSCVLLKQARLGDRVRL